MLPAAARGIPGAESPVPDNGGPNLWQPAHGAHLVGGSFSPGKLFVFNLNPSLNETKLFRLQLQPAVPAGL